MQDDELDPVWRALASATRRRILDALRDGPATTGALAELFPELSRYAVMQHLGVLTDADLVVARRVGRERFNYLNPVPVQRIYDRWVVRYMQPWTEALVSLREQLETEQREGHG
ncbi:MAG TPA: metalloregulator ArsR/SmtB family transcription factor [Longimicrobiales bacterium]|nr:metalloregulator ArsR/SmtB family transcription factor [Longimicrobiales bacterium]